MLKEIRIHGRGGMGTVKAAEILVYAAVKQNKYGNSIPFFGFERQGAPVTAFVRIDDKPIRPKNQVYNPNGVVVLEASIMNAVDVFEGLQEGSAFILNTSESLDQIKLPSTVARVALVDATSIALELLGRPITNSVMLGAFIRATGWLEPEPVSERVGELFGDKNVQAFQRGYELVAVSDI